MKTKYTKKQITEAIAHWKKVLESMNESEVPVISSILDKEIILISTFK